MSYLLEALGRGLIGHLSDAFAGRLDRRTDFSQRELFARSEQNPEDAEAHLELGLTLLANGQAGQARDALERAVRLTPKDPLTHICCACCLEHLGLLSEAIDALSRAAELTDDDAGVQFALAYCNERLGRVGLAVNHYEQSLKTCPGLRNAHERLAAISTLISFRLLTGWNRAFQRIFF